MASLHCQWLVFASSLIRMRGRLLLLTLVGVVLITTPVMRAADVAVHIHRHLQGDSAPIKGMVIAESVSDAGRSLSFPFPSMFISLPPGDWFLSARLPGDWSEPRLVSIHEGPMVADLNTYPLARITAR